MEDLPKWEYKLVGFVLDNKTADISEQTLNREGENGWEVAAVMDGRSYYPNWHVALMKRFKR